jgi:hypothetical protein
VFVLKGGVAHSRHPAQWCFVITTFDATAERLVAVKPLVGG